RRYSPGDRRRNRPRPRSRRRRPSPLTAMPGHWLFKSEPNEYSIDDLAKEPKKTGRWDGIRNYQARNFLRDKVKENDLVFFYHSSCKQPGIVGIAKIVSAPYPDPGQFLPHSPY